MSASNELSETSAVDRQACLCLFLGNNKIVVRREASLLRLFGCGRSELARARVRLAALDEACVPVSVESGEEGELLFAALDALSVPDALAAEGWEAMPLQAFYDRAGGSEASARWAAMIRRQAIRIPYLYLGDSDYIYRFRAERERNRNVYQVDASSVALYHSALCDAIKAVKRAKERSATSPALLDFGPTQFLLPSHFGFCLGVQNAIERAYETIAANPDRRVFMLSELIHNPFVNEDLKARGLKYLQSDKGKPLVDEGSGKPYWETLTDEDIVIIPAFGARDEDKIKLIERGLPIRQYDATCMLVEKVWKAARRYGQQGYTVVIHGKAEHEETKATFSNSAKYAPSIVIRDLKEAQALGQVIAAQGDEEKRRLFAPLAGKASSGFDPARDLRRIAVVNQTTLLRNETLKIIDFLQETLASVFGAGEVEQHIALSSKGDTLCYATQVNQDALSKALGQDVDVAIVVGGKNSSNTFQLFRLCEERFGVRAFYIQSELNILDRERVQHFVFPYDPSNPSQGLIEERPFLPRVDRPLRILVTGGASCPDGLLQQVICRINGFFEPRSLRSIESVLEDLQ